MMETQITPHMPPEDAWILLRPKQGEEDSGRPLTDPEASDRVEEAPLILCRNCGYPITSRRERIEIDSTHHHTFANPNGYLFEIGCFRDAPGCAATGMRTNEFTWFAGYTWRICLCRSCHAHLGWLFQSLRDHFFGLILDRLTEP